jgi:hypothetical protein
MINLESISEEMNEDVQSVIDWCKELYDTNFAEYFKEERELFKRLESKTHPITDEELEWILTTLPLQLFSVSEKLSKLKITQEVVKMKNKQKTAELVNTSAETTQTKKREEAENFMLENKLLDTVYASVISRVDSEVSFSRELIMSAKKIWDRRRQTESSSPINPIDTSNQIQKPSHGTFYEQQLAAKGQPIF